MSDRLVVGLTGGIASGKSTVAEELRRLGCTVVDADQLVAELYRPGQPGARAVAEIFGEDLLDASGAVDRRRLADLVFSDEARLRQLEAAIHPLVGQAFQRLLERSEGIVVYEVPLLAETGGRGRFDVVVTVEADPELRIRRAVERGIDEPSARARLAAQATTEERVAVADHVLRNDAGLEELRHQVERLHRQLLARLPASPRDRAANRSTTS